MIASARDEAARSDTRARARDRCGAGANLLALAYASPEVRAVGIDLAHTAIEEANEAAAEVGIPNAEFHTPT